MAQAVYSKQFVLDSGDSAYGYECPAGFVALVTCIDVYVGIVLVDGNFTLSTDADTVVWSQGYDSPGEQYSKWRGKLVLTAGQSFDMRASDVFSCSVAGDLLTAP